MANIMCHASALPLPYYYLAAPGIMAFQGQESNTCEYITEEYDPSWNLGHHTAPQITSKRQDGNIIMLCNLLSRNLQLSLLYTEKTGFYHDLLAKYFPLVSTKYHWYMVHRIM